MSMVDVYKPTILALLEIRMSYHRGITKTLGFSYKIQYPASGNSGGLVLIWKDDNINITDISVSPQAIHTSVQLLNPLSLQFITIVYVSTQLEFRKDLLNQITTFANTINQSINNSSIIGEDFNVILRGSEKFSRNSINNSRAKLLWNCINSSGLIDLGFKRQ